MRDATLRESTKSIQREIGCCAAAVIALAAAVAVPAAAQGDVFSSNSGPSGQPCTQARAAENALYQSNRAALQKRDIDIQTAYQRDSASCGNDQGCRKAASQRRNDAIRQNGAARGNEEARHSKALIDLRTGGPCAAAPVPAETDTSLPQIANLPFNPLNLVTAESLTDFVIDQFPKVGQGTIDATFVGKEIFLRISPNILAKLITVYNQAVLKARPLSAKRKRTPTQESDLKLARTQAELARQNIRNLRILYTNTWNELGALEKPRFLRPEELNFPF